jgi:hypothetical protein
VTQRKSKQKRPISDAEKEEAKETDEEKEKER